jgi:hypothetical protein
MVEFPIYYTGNRVGNAVLEKQGMFYKIRCHCNVQMDKPAKIRMTAEGITLDLGICLKCQNGIGLSTRINTKILEGKSPSFSLHTDEEVEITLYSISENAPFAYLEYISQGKFIRKEENAYILLPHASMSKPTGQWSEPKTSE